MKPPLACGRQFPPDQSRSGQSEPNLAGGGADSAFDNPIMKWTLTSRSRVSLTGSC